MTKQKTKTELVHTWSFYGFGENLEGVSFDDFQASLQDARERLRAGNYADACINITWDYDDEVTFRVVGTRPMTEAELAVAEARRERQRAAQEKRQREKKARTEEVERRQLKELLEKYGAENGKPDHSSE